ncbi:acid protease [Coprinopsis marcescibilis]|uniref:Acid protease n=1 Tax=Coprinopsis marcescibilis TaxID=230819 RepID=A0A5C3KV21_COPMA|nr:acid protease [Coprinopsis marcescibilis]
MIPSASFVATALLLGGVAVNAASIDLRQLKRSPTTGAPLTLRKRDSHLMGHGDGDISTFMEGVYTATVQLGGQDYNVVLTTGSSDMWVDTAPAESETWDYPMTFLYEYSNGTLTLEGTVASAPLQLGTYRVEEQAFLDVDDKTHDFFKLAGVNGILGLGLDRSNSTIDMAVKEKEGAETTWGQSFIYNMFETGIPKYITLNLERTEDLNEVSGGSITIGELPEHYEAIKDAPKIELYPPTSPRWTIVVDKFEVGGETVRVHSHLGAAHRAGVALVETDLATPGGYLPTTLLDEVYGKIPGAAKWINPATNNTRWIVPCSHPLQLSYYVGEHEYPLHPLDLTRVWEERPADLQDYTVCVNTISGYNDVKPDHDISLGYSFLRNVHTLFDFGTNGNPYIQFYTERDWTKSQEEFALHREPSKIGKEMNPDVVVDLLEKMNSPSHHHHQSGSAATATGSEPEASRPTGSRNSGSRGSARTGDADSGGAVAGDGTDDGTLKKYMPVILGLLGGNLLVGLVLIGLAILNYVKRSGQAKKSGTPHYVPVMKDGDQQVLFDSDGSSKRYGS